MDIRGHSACGRKPVNISLVWMCGMFSCNQLKGDVWKRVHHQNSWAGLWSTGLWQLPGHNEVESQSEKKSANKRWLEQLNKVFTCKERNPMHFKIYVEINGVRDFWLGKACLGVLSFHDCHKHRTKKNVSRALYIKRLLLWPSHFVLLLLWDFPLCLKQLFMNHKLNWNKHNLHRRESPSECLSWKIEPFRPLSQLGLCSHHHWEKKRSQNTTTETKEKKKPFWPFRNATWE